MFLALKEAAINPEFESHSGTIAGEVRCRPKDGVQGGFHNFDILPQSGNRAAIEIMDKRDIAANSSGE